MEFKFLVGYDGISLAAQVGGDPTHQTVLLLHDAGQTRHEWAHLARRLILAGFHVVSLDLRGHGASQWHCDYSLSVLAADIRVVMDALPGTPAVVGSLLGGLAALAAISEARREGLEIASALVIADPHAGQECERRILETCLAGGSDDFDAAIRSIASQAASIGLSTLHKYLRQQADGRWYWHSDPRVWLYPHAAAAEPAWSELRLPLLLIEGPIASPALERIGRQAPAARRLRLESGRGALFFADDLDALDRNILAFIADELSAGTPAANALTLRRALGAFATGVTVITTTDASGRPVGLTANSFTSVSMDPPLVLFCLDKRSASLNAFERSEAFAINVLSSQQQDISRRFASRAEDRFAATPWETWELKVPIIQNAAASIECEKHSVVDAGDHLIFLGRIHHTWLDPQRAPLLYFQGGYQQVLLTRANA